VTEPVIDATIAETLKGQTFWPDPPVVHDPGFGPAIWRTVKSCAASTVPSRLLARTRDRYTPPLTRLPMRSRPFQTTDWAPAGYPRAANLRTTSPAFVSTVTTIFATLVSFHEIVTSRPPGGRKSLGTDVWTNPSVSSTTNVCVIPVCRPSSSVA